MRDRKPLTSEIKDLIVKEIRTRLSPRHVPAFILQIGEIPWTINGKKVEIAVKKILSGQDVTPSSTVSNPESLKAYYKYREVEEKKLTRL
jgi:acetoacetyl-CoA synthetase